MAFTPTKQLISDSDIYLRSQQHASRLFVDDQFRLLPKSDFLFHVAFSINSKALTDIELSQKHKNEINMLVKSIDLPSFTLTTEVLNQYNRKKIIQQTHKFGEITVKFHDDNISIINKLWQNYYRYYYADSIASQTGRSYTRNATKNSSYINSTYGLDNGSTAPFFNYITIYQMARHEYVSYKLINPIITSWKHNSLDYSKESAHDFEMKLAYESVAYGSGVIDKDNGPEGFAVEHYDLTPSPLSTATTLDAYGNAVLNTASPSMNGITSSNTSSTLSTILQQNSTYQNLQTVNNTTPSGSSLNNLTSQSVSGVSGLTGVTFPTSTSSNATVATQINTGIV